MAVEVILPRVDMDMTTGKLTRWFKSEGEAVDKGATLFEIETDKAAMEIDAPASGVLRGVSAKAGDELPVGSVIAWIYAVDEPYDAAAARIGRPSVAAPQPAATDATPDQGRVKAISGSVSPSIGVRATPQARMKARQSGIDIAAIKGSGPRGRVQARDVAAGATMIAPVSKLDRADDRERFAQGAGESRPGTTDEAKAAFAVAGALSGGAASPDVPTVDFAKFGPVETAPLSRIQRIAGPRLHASWLNIPHVTHCDEADVTDLDAFRKTLDEEAKADKKAPYRVSLLPLVMKASVATLKQFPTFNAALAQGQDALILRHYWHIGVAVDTVEGLVVAVVKDVDKKGVIELARELGALSAKAREGKLLPSEMHGSTFTISSLGGIGGTAFTPIVNAPEVAILGVVRSKMAPVWDGAAFQPRLMLPLCLSYDHRVIDGATAARFSRHLAQTLGDMRRALL
ncbi:MAG: 2-oxo acid dehydrogenase subunit E2 [Roseiarcus sp.]|jgi:pyruvate dehydrogenase E2 component (dihydrolipoamide acetyltransferase)